MLVLVSGLAGEWDTRVTMAHISYRLHLTLSVLYCFASLSLKFKKERVNIFMKLNHSRLRWIMIFVLGVLFWTSLVRADGDVVHFVYFYADTCSHCKVVEEEILTPLKADYGSQLNIRYVEISSPNHYELLIETEQYFAVSNDARGLPTLVAGERILIGEAAIREELPALIESALAYGGLALPDMPGLNVVVTQGPSPFAGVEGAELEICDDPAEAEDACAIPTPVWAAYFYQVGCQECSRAEADIQYIRSRYPQLTIKEFNIYEDAALSQWLAEQAGYDEEFHTPLIFIGEDVLVGAEEITPQRLETLLERYAESGAAPIWEDFDPEAAEAAFGERFLSLGPLTIILAGLVDGLNPCAFATLIFFVSYLTISGRKGREALLVGGAFTLGVFLAYLAIGMGFYKVLDSLGDTLMIVRNWVYGATALLCLILAVMSVLDFFKARRGDIGDMALNLPHALRKRINATIRQGRHSRTFVISAFFVGIMISFLELACTGQMYLPIIIAVSSQPGLRTRAFLYLVLYNLLFILPLVVVFVLTYFGTTAKELTQFLHKNAAIVKLGMATVFMLLAVWLGYSLLSSF